MGSHPAHLQSPPRSAHTEQGPAPEDPKAGQGQPAGSYAARQSACSQCPLQTWAPSGLSSPSGEGGD